MASLGGPPIRFHCLLPMSIERINAPNFAASRYPTKGVLRAKGVIFYTGLCGQLCCYPQLCPCDFKGIIPLH